MEGRSGSAVRRHPSPARSPACPPSPRGAWPRAPPRPGPRASRRRRGRVLLPNPGRAGGPPAAALPSPRARSARGLSGADSLAERETPGRSGPLSSHRGDNSRRGRAGPAGRVGGMDRVNSKDLTGTPPTPRARNGAPGFARSRRTDHGSRVGWCRAGSRAGP